MVLTHLEIAPIASSNTSTRRTAANGGNGRRMVPKGVDAYRITRHFKGHS